jgi:hypothetical protein
MRGLHRKTSFTPTEAQTILVAGRRMTQMGPSGVAKWMSASAAIASLNWSVAGEETASGPPAKKRLCGKSAPHELVQLAAARREPPLKSCAGEPTGWSLETPTCRTTTKSCSIGSTSGVPLAIEASKATQPIPSAVTNAPHTMQQALQQSMFALERVFCREIALDIVIAARELERKCKVPKTFYDAGLQALFPTPPLW